METLLILIGGDETTRHVITGGMYQLLQHPAQLVRLRQAPTEIPLAVEEMLRWASPIQNMARTATEDATLRGQTIRAGQKLLLLYPSANRDALPPPRVRHGPPTQRPPPSATGRISASSKPGAAGVAVFFEEVIAVFPR
jgi:hypothetical protein